MSFSSILNFANKPIISIYIDSGKCTALDFPKSFATNNHELLYTILNLIGFANIGICPIRHYFEIRLQYIEAKLVQSSKY